MAEVRVFLADDPTRAGSGSNPHPSSSTIATT